jgi:hypothetical protein
MTVSGHLNAPPLGIKNRFRIYQAGYSGPPSDDPTPFGSKWLFRAWVPYSPVIRLRYDGLPPYWYNSTGGRLLSFDHPVPWP